MKGVCGRPLNRFCCQPTAEKLYYLHLLLLHTWYSAQCEWCTDKKELRRNLEEKKTIRRYSKLQRSLCYCSQRAHIDAGWEYSFAVSLSPSLSFSLSMASWVRSAINEYILCFRNFQLLHYNKIIMLVFVCECARLHGWMLNANGIIYNTLYSNRSGLVHSHTHENIIFCYI